MLLWHESSMSSYRLKMELVAVAHKQSHSALKVVTLSRGTIVSLGYTEAKPHRSGLVDVSIGTEAFWVFMQDLEERGERI